MKLPFIIFSMTYIKKPKLTIDQQIRLIFSYDKNLFNQFHFLNPTLCDDIRSRSKKLLDNKKIASISRKINSKLKNLAKEDWYDYISSMSFEYSQFVRMLGYVQQNKKWIKWSKEMEPSYRELITFQKQGIVQTDLSIKTKYYGKYQNIYFKNLRKLIFFIFNNEGHKIITINRSFVRMLQTRFHIQESSIRSIIANLERYQEFQKIESNMFTLARNNKLEIASKMLNKVNLQVSRINYFTKNIFMNLISSIVIENKLLWDEPYYIFKEQYKNKFYFSSGNEMFFTTNQDYSNYTMDRRIKHFIKTPQILTLDEMESKIGLNKFSVVNSKLVRLCGKNFLIYDSDNHNHRLYLKNALQSFIENQQQTFFTNKDVRQFLESSNDINIKRFSKYKQMKLIITDLFNFIYYDKSRQIFMFKN